MFPLANLQLFMAQIGFTNCWAQPKVPRSNMPSFSDRDSGLYLRLRWTGGSVGLWWLMMWSVARGAVAVEGTLQLIVEKLINMVSCRPMTHYTAEISSTRSSIVERPSPLEQCNVDQPEKFSLVNTFPWGLVSIDCIEKWLSPLQIKIKSNVFVTCTWLADVNASVAKCLCF